MAKSIILSLLLLLAFAISITDAAAGPAKPRARHSRSGSYLEESCKNTRYPKLCMECLSGFPNASKIQDPQKLAQLALTASLYKTHRTRLFLVYAAKQLQTMKAREYPAVKDCMKQIDDGIFQLSQSIRELRRMESAPVNDDTFFHISNVYSWTSAALTDATNCVGYFPIGRNTSKLKATIKGKLLNVAQVTSNALALFHRYASKYQFNHKP